MARGKKTAKSSRLVDRLAVGNDRNSLVPVAKSLFIGEDGGAQSNALHDQDQQNVFFKNRGTLPPLYDPNLLTLVFENSSVLRPNVDAYVTNIDSFGHTFATVIDVESPEAREKIKDELRTQKVAAKASGKKGTAIASTEPAESEVDAQLDQLTKEIRAERVMLENFFENCTVDMPFSGPEGLRGLTRQDVEVVGSGYWEVLRNGLGEIAQFNYLPSRTIRLMPVDKEATEVEISQRVSLFTTKTVKARKKFRKHVQIAELNNLAVYFKEFGDPRFVDAATGVIFPDAAAAAKEASDNGKKFVAATEILPFRITSTRSPYGVPRWIGTLLAVLGTRQSEEVNFLYFENRSVPPMAVLVSGGRLNADSVKRLEDYIGTEIRGKRNFHKIMILEADAGGSGDANTGRMKIVLQPLTDAQQKDGLFQEFEEKNADKVGQAFRLPRLLRGDVRDFNRSTAEASIDFAEIQVFGPIRQQFDWMMNKLILPALKVKYHLFKSNAPTVRDPNGLGALIEGLVTANVLTPGEGRELAAGVFNRDFEKIKADWTEQPIGVTLAGRKNGGDGGGGGLDDFEDNGGMSAGGAGPTQRALGVDQKKARKLGSIAQRVHKALLAEERKAFDESKAEHVRVPLDVWYAITGEKPA